MTISLVSDVMARGEKLQLAMSSCCNDTGCIEIIAGCAAGQQKAPDRSGLSETLVFTSGRHRRRRILL
jgi:hypothetical protein